MTLSNNDIRLLQQSFFKIENQFGFFSDHFYQKLFQMRPDLRPMFSEDLSSQKQKLVSSLSIIINGCDHFESILPQLSELGSKHISYGVSNNDYKDVGESLLSALEATSGDDWNDELEQVWRRAYSAITKAMLAEQA